MCLNHPKAIPAQSLEKLSSMKLVPGAKKVWGLLCYVINSVPVSPLFWFTEDFLLFLSCDYPFFTDTASRQGDRSSCPWFCLSSCFQISI